MTKLQAAAATEATEVEAKNIALSYDGGKTFVLKDINLKIAPGEFFALLGPSGSGKSTLLRLIAGFNQAQSGQLLIDGKDVSQVPAHLRDVGMVFQSYALWPHMTVAENVGFGLVERKWAKPDVARKVGEMLELVGLQDYARRRPNQLSGGQQQRVALARTLAISPKVLLLDEPLSNLDAKLRVQMREELKALQRRLGITTIFVTHDQEEALATSDRIAVMDGGVIQQIGRPEKVYDDPVNRFVANFIGTINLVPARVKPIDETIEPLTRDARTVLIENAVWGEMYVPAFGFPTAGTQGEVMVRPLALHLAPAGAPARPMDMVIDGEILSCEFMGEYVRYRVKTPATTLIADQSHRSHTPMLKVGTAVRVAVAPQEFRFI